MIEVKSEELEKYLKDLTSIASNPAELLEEIGNALFNIVEESFENQSSPAGEAWDPLAASTINKKQGKGKILFDSGEMQRSLNIKIDGDSVSVGLNAFSSDDFPYPAVHQFGTDKAGRDNSTKIPARPFLPVNNSGNLEFGAEAEIINTIEDFLNEI